MMPFDWRLFQRRCALAAMLAMAWAAASEGRAAIITAGQTATLAQLIGGDTIVVGDKVFSDFSYAPTGDMPDPLNVAVQGIVSGNSVILQFSGAFRDLPGGVGSNAGLGFNVTVTDPLKVISDVRLAGTLQTLGANAEVKIDEGFSGLPGATDPNFPDMYIMRQVIAGIPSPFNQTEDSVNFLQSHGVQGFQAFRVLKDIFADAGDGQFNAARVTTFTQTFDQEPIPEPATLVLAGISGLAMVRIVRRRG